MRIPLIQLGFLLVLSLIAFGFLEQLLSFSLFVGGLLVIVPHAYFSFYAFRYMGASSTRLVAQSFYRGESGKYMLTLVGFGLVFWQFETVNLPLLFTGYVVMLMLQWWLTARAIK
jgi:ATP synthase protein I